MKISHIIMVRAQPSVSEEQMAKAFATIAALQNKVPGMLEITGVLTTHRLFSHE